MTPLQTKRVLLVHPLGYRAAQAGSDISRLASIMPPLGLASIAAYLEQQGIAADLLDCYAHPDSDRRFQDYLLATRPAFLALSCTTSSFNDGLRMTRMAKTLLPGIQVVFGGPHVSALKQRVLKDHPEIDFTVVGEGEETMAELVASDGQEPSRVPGLVYREGDGQVMFNGYRAQGIVLDSLPFPAYEKLQGFPHSYQLPIFNYPKAPNTSCISSRGCPYACSYCDRSVFQRTFRYNSAEYLYEHLRYLKERFGIRHINFYDDQFTFNRQRVEDFTGMMMDRPLGMTYNCAARAEHIDPELLRSMKASGCWMMSLGIESGDEALLAQHRQNPNLQLLSQKLHEIKAAGIRTKGLLMMGLPGESEQSIERSMDFVLSQPIDDFNLAKFTPFPGSPIYENAHELGSFDENWERMDCMNFLFIPHGMTEERLEELFIRFYKTHFMRPSVLLGYVSMLWKSPHSWMRFVKNLWAFMMFARSNKRHGKG